MEDPFNKSFQSSNGNRNSVMSMHPLNTDELVSISTKLNEKGRSSAMHIRHKSSNALLETETLNVLENANRAIDKFLSNERRSERANGSNLRDGTRSRQPRQSLMSHNGSPFPLKTEIKGKLP